MSVHYLSEMTAVLMTDRDDFELLREYADHGSQPAFCELVRRYIDLVYSSAARQVRDAHAAEDVTQTVFIVLTRKAKEIKPRSMLAAWLLGVTRFAAKDHLKRARRRRHYEQAAALERTAVMASASNSASIPVHSGVAGASGDAAAHPLSDALDDALANLSSSARDAMVLRFFEDQSFKEVGERLGISELAARQRVFRGLEQLRAILGRRGVSLSAESLAVALAATAVLPAPGALSTAVAATAMSAAAAAPYANFVKGTVWLMKSSAIKPAVLTALLLLLGAAAVVAVMNWPAGDPKTVVVANPSAARVTPTAGVRTGTRGLLDIIPPENYSPPSFGWVTPAPIRPAAQAPYAGPPVSGTVLSPDGKPLGGVEVMISTSANVPRPQGGTRVDYIAITRPDGRFQLQPRREPVGLFIKSSEGWAYASAESIKPDQSITLSRWGRLELSVKQGAKPMSKARVMVYPAGAGDLQAAFGMWSVLTDDEGRVTIEQALPGENRITWAAEDSAKRPARERREDAPKLPPREMRVKVEAGKTQQVALGGVGRAVTGAIDADMSNFDYRRGVLRSGQSGTIYFDAQPDGSFTVMDVPPGEYEVAIDLGVTLGKNIKIVENYGAARATFTMPPIAEGSSEAPLDIGKVRVSEKKVLEVGEPFPKLAGKTPKAEPLSIDHFHGRIVLVQAGNPSAPRSRGEVDWQHAVHSRFGHYPQFAMLTLLPGQSTGAEAAVEQSILWPVMRVDAQRLPEELEASTARLFLVDENGNVAAKNVTAAQVYAILDKALDGKADPLVKFDYVAGIPALKNPPYENIPAVSADDAAAGASVSIIAGVPSWDTPKRDVNVLTDGKMLPTEDAPGEALFFQAGTLEGRFRIDVKEPTNVAEIRTYSWHKDTRAAQVYRVFGSDGTAENFDPAPAIGMDPARYGWTNIAFVDTRPDMKPVGVQYEAIGGRYVSSISDKEKGTLGTYRHLLFQVFVTEADDVFGHTFYGEIDVIAQE